MKLQRIYERLKDSLYISSMNCPYAKVSFNLLELYDENLREYVTADDLDELDGSLTTRLQKSFETPQLQRLMGNYAEAEKVLIHNPKKRR